MLNAFIADTVNVVPVRPDLADVIVACATPAASKLIFPLPDSEIEPLRLALDNCAAGPSGAPSLVNIQQVIVSRSPSGMVRLATIHHAPRGTEIAVYLPEVLRYELSAFLKRCQGRSP